MRRGVGGAECMCVCVCGGGGGGVKGLSRDLWGGGGDSLTICSWWSLYTLHLCACRMRVTAGDSRLCCCVCGKCFESPFNSLVRLLNS